ncbi:uncharacterized protein PADG_04813 [Paracoccidioides brasiliensis Pb18]|uniref:Uncharacterized protein n=1 Tax=Paracoccidioides brasiliensis (strain Pb18) TaxID=502780 RepID=C1GCU1_PARBD|nr:uncharacterized protein PADG_04813 [Paracoccidioides brasiliensis Pb18]EEH48734.1 hypothetical protein PADG_04813 [Paracoccidioides brasiliensis Pb18]
MASATAFFQFWWTDLTRDAFLDCLPKEDLLSMRLVCHDFSQRTAPVLFKEVEVSFRNGTFTRPARMAALERIGTYIKTLKFNIPHTPETFLPPLVHPVTGQEQTFVYEPQIFPSCPAASRLSFPRYGTWEMTELLTKQYPPLFHAVANVPSFIRAFNAMTSLRHLKVSCDGQAAGHRYRRSVVDYALISLRIAIEQTPLKSLETLTLQPIHPGAVLYLRPNLGFGASPGARKRWSQIRNLSIEMDSFPYDDDNIININSTTTTTASSSSRSSNHSKNSNSTKRPQDHLKLLHSYLQSFPNLTRFTFRWRGQQGPCPLSLPTEPCLQPTATEPSTTLCPTRFPAPPQPLKFPSLQYAEVENAFLDASQVSIFILEHRRTVREFNFENTTLRTGNWDEALAPLTRISGSEGWKEKQREEMEVPIMLMLGPVGFGTGRSQVQKVRWEEERSKDRLKNFRAYGDAGSGGGGSGGGGGGGGGGGSGNGSSSHFQRASLRTRDMFWGRQEHVRKFWKSSVFSWR